MLFKFNFEKNLFSGTYFKGVFAIFSGTLIAQLINFAVAPILTRLYSAEDFGQLAVFISVINIIGVFACGRFELAQVIPKSESMVRALTKLSFIILSGVVTLTLIVLLLFPELTTVLKLNKLAYWVPLGVLALGIFNILNYLRTRHENYSKISAALITKSLSTAGIKIALFFSKFMSSGLIMGYIFGQLFSILPLLSIKSITRNEEKTPLLKAFKKYKDFPFKTGISSILNLLANQLPVLLLVYFFDKDLLGFYALVMQVLNMPLNLVGKAISQVYFKEISKRVNEKRPYYYFVLKNTFLLFILGLIPTVFILIWGQELFQFVFGNEWGLSGQIAKIFTLFYLFRFVYFSQSMYLIAVGKLNLEIIFNAFFLVSQLLGLLLGAYLFKDGMIAFILMAFSGAFIYLLILIYVLLHSRKSVMNV